MKFVPRVIWNLAGATNARFVDDLVAQTDAAIAGAALVRRAVAGEIGRAAALEEMQIVEHDGDAMRASLIRELGAALVTPIDREDLFRLSRSIDDILDNLRDFLRSWDLFEMDGSPVIDPAANGVCDALVVLRAAVAIITDEPAMITRRALAAKKAGNAIRRTHDAQLAVLYRQPLTIETFKQRDLLRRIDVVGLRFGTAADILSDAAIKRAES